MDIRNLTDSYFFARTALREAFGCAEEFPLEDERNSFWRLNRGVIEWADSREECETGADSGYESEVYNDLIHRTDTLTAVAIDTDGAGYCYLIFDNAKEVSR